VRVLNKRKDEIPKDAVYVGRPTPFGNPFVIGEGRAVGRPITRVEAVERFREYFRKRVSEEAGFRKAVEALRGRDLVCWCAPERCHAEVIVEYLEGNSAT